MEKQTFWIKGYEGKYSINQFGEVFSHRNRWGELPEPKQRSAVLGQNGYYVFSLYKNNKEDRRYLHRMLAEMFLPRMGGKNFVNHKDGNKKNNALANLEWVTQKENNQHGFRTGLNNPLRGSSPGEKCPASKLKDGDVLKIRKLYPKVDRKELSERYGVTVANIMMIINRKTWKHL